MSQIEKTVDAELAATLNAVVPLLGQLKSIEAKALDLSTRLELQASQAGTLATRLDSATARAELLQVATEQGLSEVQNLAGSARTVLEQANLAHSHLDASLASLHAWKGKVEEGAQAARGELAGLRRKIGHMRAQIWILGALAAISAGAAVALAR